jgi:hypothetical protein
MNKEANRRGGTTTQTRYGSDFIAARARRGLLASELAKVARPERLTPDEIAAVYRQLMRRQAARMRAAKAAKRAVQTERSAPVEK